MLVESQRCGEKVHLSASVASLIFAQATDSNMTLCINGILRMRILYMVLPSAHAQVMWQCQYTLIIVIICNTPRVLRKCFIPKVIELHGATTDY